MKLRYQKADTRRRLLRCIAVTEAGTAPLARSARPSRARSTPAALAELTAWRPPLF
ncbi:MAG: hypothetical protein KAY12_02170 [Arenimonas sp.]|nr:hypothetical protein [Arenimonas sp.]